MMKSTLRIMLNDRVFNSMFFGLMMGCFGCDEPNEPIVRELNESTQDAAFKVQADGIRLEAQLRAVYRAKPDTYRPRTRHIRADGEPKYINRLILETSPYLRQHAHNPVNWYPWGDLAFEHARRDDKPVLLSIGYSTCHWCHVMERESFEDEVIAAYINEHYIAVKVDREERPDVDDIYMKAVQMLTGRGGWPMTTVLTWDRKPFFGGTYFPARDGDRGRKKGFLSILRTLRHQYTNERGDLIERARSTSQRIANFSVQQYPGQIPGPTAIERAARRLAKRFDVTWGGFGAAPKFPTPVHLELLLRYYRRTEDHQALDMVVHTLKRMAQGGIYDQLAGGFHRYSTDRRWLVPHFEKMLYDNAQLVPVYLEAYQLTGDEFLRDIAEETLAYIRREMTNAQGGFYSATDADSPVPETAHEEEGWFFTWTPTELKEALSSDESLLVLRYYGITQRGNFENRNILHTPLDPMAFASETGRPASEFKMTLMRIKARLRRTRQQRPPPIRDEKVIASWNGLMISAFARAALMLDKSEYVESARRSAEFLLRHLKRADGGLYRTFMEDQGRHMGVLDDYAFVIQGLLDLFETTGEVRWVVEATNLQKRLDAQHWDVERGGYFMTGNDAEGLIARDKPHYDGAEPSGNSVAALNLLRLSTFTGQQVYRNRAEEVFAAFSTTLRRRGSGLSKMLSALDYYLDEPYEILVVSPPGHPEFKRLMSVVRGMFLPNSALIVTQKPESLIPWVPWVEGKYAIDNKATAFVCKQGTCERPTSKPNELRQQLSKTRQLFENRTPMPLAVRP